MSTTKPKQRRPRRKKGQFTVHILGQSPIHCYPRSWHEVPIFANGIVNSGAAPADNPNGGTSARAECTQVKQPFGSIQSRFNSSQSESNSVAVGNTNRLTSQMGLPYPRPDRLIQTVKGNDTVTHSNEMPIFANGIVNSGTAPANNPNGGTFGRAKCTQVKQPLGSIQSRFNSSQSESNSVAVGNTNRVTSQMGLEYPRPDRLIQTVKGNDSVTHSNEMPIFANGIVNSGTAPANNPNGGTFGRAKCTQVKQPLGSIQSRFNSSQSESNSVAVGNTNRVTSQMGLEYPRPDRLIQTVKGNDSVTHSNEMPIFANGIVNSGTAPANNPNGGTFGRAKCTQVKQPLASIQSRFNSSQSTSVSVGNTGRVTSQMGLPYPRPDRLIQTVKGNDSVTHSEEGHDEPPRNPPSDPWSDEKSDECRYYFCLGFLPTALSPRLYTYPFKYIQTVYFDLSSRLQIIAMLDFERREYCCHIFPSPSNLRFVTVQTTNFADGKQGDLVSCDCTPSSNHFRSVFMGKDFPAEPAEKYTQLSKLYECIHTRVACKYLLDTKSGHQNLPTPSETLQIPSLVPFKIPFLCDLWVIFDGRDGNFYPVWDRNSKLRCRTCKLATQCRHVRLVKKMLSKEESQRAVDDEGKGEMVASDGGCTEVARKKRKTDAENSASNV